MKFLNPLTVGKLFLAGFLLGILLISLGWADQSSHVKKHHKKHAKTVAHHSHKKSHKIAASHAKNKKATLAHHAKKAKPSQAVARRPHALAPKLALNNYAHPEGYFHLNYPANWQVNAKDNAMIMKSAGLGGDRGVFGIVRRDDSVSNEDAVTKEFQAPNRPADLVKTPSQVAGMPATKVVGSGKEDPNNRMVEYYVQNPNGHQYYILMMAPRNEWKRYTVAFSTMLNSLSFN